MKILMSTGLLVLAVALPAVAVSEYKVPHIEGGSQTSYEGRFGPTRFIFKMHVTGRTISELQLKAPKGVSLTRSISITNQAGEKVASTIELQDQTVTISFAQPIALDSELRFSLDGVKTIDNAQTWHLETSGKLDGIQEAISLQTIRISPNYIH